MSRNSFRHGGIIPMDKSEVIEKLKKFAILVQSILTPKKIILFGSYARGNPHEYSDIDVAVVVDEITGDLLKIEAALFKKGSEIDVLIEPILLEEGNDPSGFLEYITKHGEVIYSQAGQ